MRISVDTGGTFTDLVLEESTGRLQVFKAPTTPEEPASGIFAALETAARHRGERVRDLLGQCELFIHATTLAINAVLTGNTARTAYLATEGHPDTLLFREGGRIEIFNFTVEYPEPYVPRALTFQVPERIGADGAVVSPLDEAATVEIISKLGALDVEAVAVCLLWSTVNPVHERRVGELLARHLPDLPFTLSHRLNPTLREYRRASSACIDASLKPVMSRYVRSLEERLRAAGLDGHFVMVTSQGGVKDGETVAAAPVHAINSGPAMAPVAGRHFARADLGSGDAIVADTGGTSFDVSLVRHARIPWTRETWLGEPFRGHMTGFPSIDVKSIGAGGGSVAWVDPGGMLRVGPQSAGAAPGPACYGRGGTRATVTDAALILGILDPDYFLGGRMRLERSSAERALEEQVCTPLGLDLPAGACAVLEVMTENMVQAIQGITIHQGVDPRSAVLVAGGGAAGLNAIAMARRLGCSDILIPQVGAVLSAAGALMAELGDDFAATHPTGSESFDFDGVNTVLETLEKRAAQMVEDLALPPSDTQITFSAEARYAHQVWEIEIELRAPRFETRADVDALVEDFHAEHEQVFAVRDPDSEVEVIHWHARVRSRIRQRDLPPVQDPVTPVGHAARRVVFPGHGPVEAAVVGFASLTETPSVGPAVVESPFTSVAIEPGVEFQRAGSGGLRVRVGQTQSEAVALAAKSW